MQVDDLTLKSLFVATNGIHLFAGARSVIIDAALFGLSRRALIQSTGLLATQRFVIQMGHAQGWRAAERILPVLSPSPATPHAVLLRLLALLGVTHDTRTARGDMDDAASSLVVAGSCEAEEHARHCGTSNDPVCWFVSGFASGYLSLATRRTVVCRESRCIGIGDAACEFASQTLPSLSSDDLPLADDMFTEDSSRARLLQHLFDDAPLSPAPPDRVSTDNFTQGLRSTEMRALVRLAEQAAQSDATVLITGESGTGKDGLARLVHARSRRAGQAFVAVNCGAFPDQLLDSELFGHQRGAFTGATADRPGLFEAANGGTIFLDEVGEMPFAMQVKLLRVLQEREVRRLGDTRVRAVNVRVIAATNSDIEAEVAAKRFRADLFYRLNVIGFAVPPLRARPADLVPLAQTFLTRAARRANRPLLGFTSDAVLKLRSYPWPGNVRELENVVERAAALTQNAYVSVDDLPPHIANADPTPAAIVDVRPLREIVRAYVVDALRRSGGNRSQAAALLGISRATLRRTLRATSK